MNFIFFATSTFAISILEKLLANNWRPSLVITRPDRPVGRKQQLTPPPIKLAAQNLDLEIYQPISLKTQEATEKIKAQKPEFFIIAAYGKMIPVSVLNLAPRGALNVHPSLLPKYRGPSPIQAAILNGDKKTGISIMLVDEKMDHGPILAQKEIDLAGQEEYPLLHNQLSALGADLLIKTLPRWIKDKIQPKPQDHSQATFTKLIKKENGQIDWTNPAEIIDRQIRALNPWPGTFTFWQNKRVKILKAKPLKKILKAQFGDFIKADDGRLLIAVKKGSLLVGKIQVEGKKPLTGEEFVNGYEDYLCGGLFVN